MTVGFGNWPPTTAPAGAYLGYATIDADGTILRSGGLVTAVAPKGAGDGDYILSVSPEVEGGDPGDPNIAAFVEPRTEHLISRASWDVEETEGVWEVTFRDDTGAPADTAFSITFYK